MRLLPILKPFLQVFSWSLAVTSLPTDQVPFNSAQKHHRHVSLDLFLELEELARIVDISYCVGTSGIYKPFQCASRCSEFEGFNLVTTWNTGPLLSDSCGYVALSSPPSPPRIILAFRGTYSLANTIADLSTMPQEYIPYPGEGDHTTEAGLSSFPDVLSISTKCPNCTVHLGFLTSWVNSRPYILPAVERLVREYPRYRITLAGHSLGGAVAALASLDFLSRGWNVDVTTFGEPRIGNLALMQYIDDRFNEAFENGEKKNNYRRLTHVNDPVPLLPLKEWGYRMHSGEIYISKGSLSPTPKDLHHCVGDEDEECIAGAEKPAHFLSKLGAAQESANYSGVWGYMDGEWPFPARYRIWQLFFAHRDYFWRLGLCIPGGDPTDWNRKYPHGH
ncbi:MAG: hypothetical protein M1829_003829 [Trizodia sp. TS-e1964]|nr:MAG: hypothetical protein M1829_003829 [Trizodia sp. TS-e1964]